MNILFACGGTAGHINPAVSLARLFSSRRPGSRILFVGAEGGMECTLVPKEGFDLRTVQVSSLHRSLKWEAFKHNLKTAATLPLAGRQSAEIIKEFKPDIAVGTGGYVCYPVLRQAAKLGIPTAVHESNAFPGLTTKALAKYVDIVMVGFESSKAFYSHPERVTVTGTPVRGDFFEITREEARRKLNLAGDKPLLVSFWGSLGASVMNGHMADFIARECAEGAPFHHIHGAGNGYKALTGALKERGITLPPGVEVREYIYDMPLVMAASDLVLCRAGASTISELTAISKPAILVPSPNVTSDHQTKNARVLEEAGGALLLGESDCGEGRLYEAAAVLLRDAPRRRRMASAMGALGAPDAAEQIYAALLKLVH